MYQITDFVKEIAQLNSLVLQIRRNTPVRQGSWEKPADLLIKKEFYKGKIVDAINVTLTPTGCEWAKTGGCTMCGEWSGSNLGVKIDAEYHIAQFATCIANEIPKYKSPWLRIYQEGSYMNNSEFDNFAQKTILKLGSLIKGIERITIEGMARYINEKNIKNLTDAIISPVELEIGIGFEAQDDVVRLVCVNKGHAIQQFQNAVKLLKQSGIKSLAYVLLKPAFLTEQEAIDEAVLTIKRAFKIGFDRVSLEPLSVHQWSFTEALYLNKKYQTPWLWSIIEVIKRTHGLGEIRIGGSEYFPRPDVIAHNQHDGNSACSITILNAIKRYNATHDINLFDNLSCECKLAWKKTLKEKNVSLKKRITKYISSIDVDEYIAYKKKNTDRSPSRRSPHLNP